MRICFVNPYAPSLSWFFYAQGCVTPPIGMCLQAEKMIGAGHEVLVIDGQATYEDHSKTLGRIMSWSPDVVCIMTQPLLHVYTFVSTTQFPYHSEFAERAKRKMPSVPIIVGGLYASRYPLEVLKENTAIDAVMTHFASPLTEMISGISERREGDGIPGFAVRTPDGDICMAPYDGQMEMDPTLAPEGYRLLEGYPENYGLEKSLYLDGKKREMFPLHTMSVSWGCPHKCIFCPNGIYFEQNHGQRSARVLVNSMMETKALYGIDHFLFIDDTFTTSADFIREACDLIAESGEEMYWSCFGKTKWVVENHRLLPEMKRAGCFNLYMGIEAVTDTVLKEYNKEQKMEHAFQAVRLLTDNGIHPMTSFILGNVMDSLDNILRMVEISRQFNRIGSSNVYTIMIPFPGGKLFKRLEEDNMLYTRNLRLYNGTRAVIDYPNVDREQVEEIYYNTYRESILEGDYLRSFFPLLSNDGGAEKEVTFEAYQRRLLNRFETEKKRMLNLENEHAT